MFINSRSLVATTIAATLLGCPLARADDPPSIDEFQRAYRSAYDRQVAAMNTLRIVYHKESLTLPSLAKSGEVNPAVEKTKEQLEKEQERDRRIESNNRLMKFDNTYTRSGNSQRLDIKMVHPDGLGTWRRSILLTDDGSFATQTKPDGREYVLEFNEPEPDRAAMHLNPALVFVNAARHVSPHETTAWLLGDEFEITRLLADRVTDAGGKPIDLLVADVRRVKPPKPSRVPRYPMRASLTLEPQHDYRIVHFIVDTNDGYVADGTIEYERTTGPGSLISSKLLQDIHKDGEPHRLVETYTTKEVSFKKPKGETFKRTEFGVETRIDSNSKPAISKE